ncbi:MAG: apolipoprotein N-acyltransferase [Nitrospinae bacterium]|nr:apolipoprotein N-acyltransferase [Nitrospinota bacterium]
MTFYMFGLSWVTNTLVNYGNIPQALSWLVLALLATYLSGYVALFCFLYQGLGKGNPVFSFLLAPLIWTSLEYVRTVIPVFGFAWLGLGYSQVDQLAVIQIADITGVYGVSAWIVFVNTGLFFLARGLYTKEPIHGFPLRVALVLATVSALCIGYGLKALSNFSPPDTDGLKVALVQGNIEQHLKWKPAYRDEVLRIYKKLTLEAAKLKPDLLVWPEAVTPFYFSQDLLPSRRVLDIIRKSATPLVLGSPFVKLIDGKPRLLNSAFLVSPQGEVMGRYDKIHLVPFGEFVPFNKLLWFVEKMTVGISDFASGEMAKVFELRDLRGRLNQFGVSICFEITFPHLTRQPVKDGAEFLINITNDAWFGRSAASYQHIEMAAMRAVENRVPIVRAANTGITGVIDRTGRIRQATNIFEETFLITTIHPQPAPTSFYSRYGDIFSYICIAGMLLIPLLTRKRA